MGVANNQTAFGVNGPKGRVSMFKNLLIKLYRFIFRIPEISEYDREHFIETTRVTAGESIEAEAPVYIGKDGKVYNYPRKHDNDHDYESFMRNRRFCPKCHKETVVTKELEMNGTGVDTRIYACESCDFKTRVG